jgi:pyruvate/2-oxoglutarate dehydrogenase complex dihydrolipoamide acyltransferase (E2) component
MPKLDIKVPDLGMQTEEIKFGCWLKQPGDRVEAGEDLFEVEADKATVVCEAEATGILEDTSITDGTVNTGDTVGHINVG